MKTYSNISLLLILSLFSTTMFCQEAEPKDSTETNTIEVEEEIEDEDSDTSSTTVIVEFSTKKHSSERNLITRWLTLGLGMNPVMVDGDFDLPDDQFYQDWKLKNGKSTNVDIGIVQQKLNLSKHKFYLYSGIGLDINKYMFEDNFFIDDDVDYWVTNNFNGDTKKNRLTATYLHIPLMFNYESNTSHSQSFRINAGMYGSLRLSANQKIKFHHRSDNPVEDERKFKNRDDFNMKTFVYGIKGEMGFGPINVYTKYQLADIFDESAAPSLSPFSFGIMIIPF